MNNDFHHIDLEKLIEFYHKEESSLKEALLEGVSWKEVHDKRKMVTQLAMAIHRKHPGYFKKKSNPAESANDRSISMEP